MHSAGLIRLLYMEVLLLFSSFVGFMSLAVSAVGIIYLVFKQKAELAKLKTEVVEERIQCLSDLRMMCQQDAFDLFQSMADNPYSKKAAEDYLQGMSFKDM